jgi:NAD(P)-dependent dehydrogenase (short-subunit alcohol dehydrogenase family)
MPERRVALVTAASRGLGAACAKELAERGYHLALLARSPDVLDLGKELNALAVQGSVMDENDLRGFVEAALDCYGRIDVVVNNTGHSARAELLEITDADWLTGFNLLFLNVVRIARLVTSGMLLRKRGAFVNISSFAAAEPSLQFPVSAAIRSALGSFAKLFSQRYASEGLRMNNVLPGWIASHPVAEDTSLKIPAGRPGTVEEIARTVAFLVSDDASYITGQNILVDGGLVRAL